ncbi:MAG: hypothetical protein QOF02_1329 [Blastocatellia bacterium]|jgi:hypothetical protein|nr:hypothetical protein [Blastocatellia bacterium]
MKHYTHILRYAVIALFLCGSCLSASAQDAAAPAPKQRGELDPFRVYKPTVRRPAVKIKAVPVAVKPPEIRARIDNYKAQKAQAMSQQQPAPKPTTALLLSEMQVIGIFRTPRGYAAMVEATPIKLSYVIYPGESFFDGQLVAIEEDRLVFRHETRWSDGRREMNVETKPLRQPTVADALTTDKGSAMPAGASVPAAATSSAANTTGEARPSTPDKQ